MQHSALPAGNPHGGGSPTRPRTYWNTYFSHCVRQPAHQTGAGVQALGTWRASSPRIFPVLLLQGADAETTSGLALDVMGGHRPWIGRI